MEITLGVTYFISDHNLITAMIKVLMCMDGDDVAELSEALLGGTCVSVDDGYEYTPTFDYDQDIDQYLEEINV